MKPQLDVPINTDGQKNTNQSQACPNIYIIIYKKKRSPFKKFTSFIMTKLLIITQKYLSNFNILIKHNMHYFMFYVQYLLGHLNVLNT